MLVFEMATGTKTALENDLLGHPLTLKEFTPIYSEGRTQDLSIDAKIFS
jgi:hypothetical protein